MIKLVMIDRNKISQTLENARVLKETQYPWIGKKLTGKVRDVYERDQEIVFISSDRQSAFDRNITAVPFKGQVLTQASRFWFQQTQGIIKNHLIASPDPNVMICQKLDIFPIEFVVRGYLTGVTSTSVWTAYQAGERIYCGHRLPDGMKKNQAFPNPLLTPTTKAEVDEKISREEIFQRKIMSEEHWEACAQASIKLFEFGNQLARKQGMVLVDTKYEFGIDSTGAVVLADEIHTPDSSRFWIADTYEKKFANAEDPENIDKEFLRRWISAKVDPYNQPIPDIPNDLVEELSARYIQLYEKITGLEFEYSDEDIAVRIEKNLKEYFSKKDAR